LDITLEGKKVIACSKNPRYVQGICLIDREGTGTFTRINFRGMYNAKLLPTPIAYRLDKVPIPDPKSDYRDVLVFLGVSAGSLRLGYREFSGDLARPAFSEELTFPLAPSYPQPIAFRNLRITLIGLDGAGLRYRIDPKPE